MMKLSMYEVYFEIYGKKMKTLVADVDEAGAREQVKDRIKFHKVARKGDIQGPTKDMIDAFNDIFGNIL